MVEVKGLPIVIAGLSLGASVASFIGAGFIIVTYLILPRRRHSRHVRILNLATADCVNALNQGISCLYILVTKRGLTNTGLCLTNGFIVQLAQQGTDCAILAIAIMTVYNVTRFKLQTPQPIWDGRTIVLVTLATWILPVITSIIALVTHNIGPSSGSWCWIMIQPKYLRYILSHGWRFVFIFIEIGLYIYLHLVLRKHFKKISTSTSNSFSSQSSEDSSTKQAINEGSEAALVPVSTKPVFYEKHYWFSVPAHRTVNKVQEVTDPRYKSIQRVLLLNAYPVAYIILWIPGIANRFVELSGHQSKVAQVLQVSTQLIGLANALTYGWNEDIARQLFGNKDSSGREDDV